MQAISDNIPFNIGMDISFANLNQAGTGVYVKSLLESLAAFNSTIGLNCFSVNQVRDNTKPKTLRTRLDTLYRDFFWMHVKLPHKVWKSKVQVLHMPANLAPLKVNCPVVVSILDMILYEYPQYFPRWQRINYKIFGRQSAVNAAHIITISDASKRNIVKLFQVDPAKITVTPLAASEKFTFQPSEVFSGIKTKYSIDKYIFTVGSVEPRKNLLRLFEAFETIKVFFPDYRIVHAGPRGWHMDHLEKLLSERNLTDSVKFLGLVPEDDLVKLYNAAQLFVYPSLYEGFGLPVLEAMTCGCPVITSNISSLPEVAGDAAVLVDPLETAQIAEQMRLFLTNPDMRMEYRRRGLQRAKDFSWRRCAEQTIEVYKQVLEV